MQVSTLLGIEIQNYRVVPFDREILKTIDFDIFTPQRVHYLVHALVHNNKLPSEQAMIRSEKKNRQKAGADKSDEVVGRTPNINIFNARSTRSTRPRRHFYLPNRYVNGRRCIYQNKAVRRVPNGRLSNRPRISRPVPINFSTFPPHFIGQQMPPHFIGQQPPPQIIGQQVPPHFIGQQPPPQIIGQQVPPHFIGQQPPPQIIGQQVPPHFIGQQPPPQIIGQQVPPHFIGQQPPPQIIGQQVPPHFIGQQPPPQIIGQQVPPHFIGQQPPPQIIGQQVPPHFIGQQVPPHFIGQQMPPQIIGQQVPPHFIMPPLGRQFIRQNKTASNARQLQIVNLREQIQKQIPEIAFKNRVKGVEKERVKAFKTHNPEWIALKAYKAEITLIIQKYREQIKKDKEPIISANLKDPLPPYFQKKKASQKRRRQQKHQLIKQNKKALVQIFGDAVFESGWPISRKQIKIALGIINKCEPIEDLSEFMGMVEEKNVEPNSIGIQSNQPQFVQGGQL